MCVSFFVCVSCRSGDGRLLIASSTDGYCSIISFGDRELGIPYVAPGEEDTKENVPASPENKETKSEVKGKRDNS